MRFFNNLECNNKYSTLKKKRALMKISRDRPNLYVTKKV